MRVEEIGFTGAPLPFGPGKTKISMSHVEHVDHAPRIDGWAAYGLQNSGLGSPLHKTPLDCVHPMSVCALGGERTAGCHRLLVDVQAYPGSVLRFTVC